MDAIEPKNCNDYNNSNCNKTATATKGADPRLGFEDLSTVNNFHLTQIIFLCHK